MNLLIFGTDSPELTATGLAIFPLVIYSSRMRKPSTSANPDIRDLFAVVDYRGIYQTWLYEALGIREDELTRIKRGYRRSSDLSEAEFVAKAIVALKLQDLDELHALAAVARKQKEKGDAA